MTGSAPAGSAATPVIDQLADALHRAGEVTAESKQLGTRSRTCRRRVRRTLDQVTDVVDVLQARRTVPRGDDARVRANGSTGLGLSIVAAVGQAHGGRVEVSSRPGATTFSVLLPAS